MLKTASTCLNRAHPRMMSSILSNKISQQQIEQLDDQIPIVNEMDHVIGPSTKRECHVRPPRKEADGLLHRAFSVFLFNSKKELLLQQRSSSKITFADHFTNTCCSHPRYNEHELNEHENVGIRIAARRRLQLELGIQEDEVPLDDLNFLTRIHYAGTSDNNWCEHEIDYVLICQRDVHLEVNQDEVQKVLYLSKEKLQKFLSTSNEKGVLLTPWFRYICDHFLFEWWDHLDDLSKFKNDTIHRAGRI